MTPGAIRVFGLAGFSVVLTGNAFAAPTWGTPNEEGLATRVVPLEKNYTLGKPMLFRIEAKNIGEQLVYADLQSLAHCQSLLNVADGEGEQVQPIGASIMGCQTIQDYTPFPPGKIVPLVPQVNLREEFAILKEGVYQMKYPGELYAPPKFDTGKPIDSVSGKPLGEATVFTRLPPSGIVKIEVAPGRLSVEEEMIRALQPVVPKGWFLCRRWRDHGVTIGRRDDIAHVTIDLVRVDPRGRMPMEEGHRKLGVCRHGEIGMGVTIGAGDGVGEPPANRALEDFWEGAEEAIRGALDLEPREAGQPGSRELTGDFGKAVSPAFQVFGDDSRDQPLGLELKVLSATVNVSPGPVSD